jgi:hypothetical protein
MDSRHKLDVPISKCFRGIPTSRRHTDSPALGLYNDSTKRFDVRWDKATNRVNPASELILGEYA